ncbi:B12-binding domain-containing radical SAM protein [bacterium]|nr:B12-binding domain-containing radical SAM protein [bacterium]
MVDIMLVHPAGSNWLPGLERTIRSANRMPPIGLMGISSYLKRNGKDVGLLDCCADPQPRELIVQQIIAQRPRFIGFSCTTSSFHDGHDLAVRIKESLPGATIVFGGVHVSSQKEKILESYPVIDYVVVGEGEETMQQLLDGQAPSTIPGLAFRDGPKFTFNGYGQDLLDLDSLPFPDYQGLKNFPRLYNLPIFNYPTAPNTTMITSRGCPYQCLFCDRSVFRRRYRYNSAKYIYEHMLFLKREYGIRHVNIYDDLFTYDRTRILNFTDMVAQKPLNMTFNCAVRFDLLDDELLIALKKAGCWMISLGIESGDPEVLKLNKSNADLDGIKASVLKIKKYGLRVKGLFMLGLPGETEESIQRTRDYLLALPLDDMNLAKFTPFPGAPVYRILDKYGDLEENWSKMNCMNFIFRPKDIASLARLEHLYNDLIKHYYERPSVLLKYAAMLWTSPHSWFTLLKQLPDFLEARRHFHSTSLD